jgi:membrane protein implicated in regulation of membrane protease activity
MDKLTLTIVVTFALLLVLGVLWFTWKYYFRLFKYLFIVFIFFAIAAAGIIYRMQPVEPKRNPALGKHAYLSQTGEYLGVVEGSGRDRQRGDVWFVRQPDGYRLMYSKARVMLKDTGENTEQTK